MALFKYRAVDADGNPVERITEAASARDVVLALQAQGLTVNAVEEQGRRPSFFRKKTRLTWNDLDQLNYQLLTITRGGLPLAPALAAMAHDLRNPRLKAVIEDIRKDLEAGQSLEEAFNRRPESFPPLYTTLIRAGERTGNLAGVLECLCAQSRRMIEMKNNVQELLAYPLVVVVIAAALVGFLLTKVVPVYANIFKDFGGELPAPTRSLIVLSDFIVYRFPLVLAAVGIILVFAVALLPSLFRSDSGGYARDWLKLRIPLFGRAYASTSLARFCRALGMMLTERVPVVEGMALAAAGAGNAVLSRAVLQAAQRVSSGAPLADALEQTGYFDGGFCWLLRNAEQRGEAHNALLMLEEEHERAIELMRKWTMLVVGPAVVVLVGVVIGYIVISLYLPIFSLGDVISGR
jgi:type IV pilus assembly protein PilC